MKHKLLLACLAASVIATEAASAFSLTVKVNSLRNSQGVIQFSLYNKDGTIPDEKYEHYFQQQTENIHNNSSSTTFHNLPSGQYAVNILHDENSNGKIEKGFILPIEGVGFSNYTSIGLGNFPNFKDASFDLSEDSEKAVNIIYF